MLISEMIEAAKNKLLFVVQNQGQQILEGSYEHTFNFDWIQTFWRETAPTSEIIDTYARSVNKAFFFFFQTK